MNPPDPIKARLMSAVAAQPSRTRGQGRRRAIAFYGGAALLMLAVFQLAGGLAHGAGRPVDITARLVLGSAMIALVSTVVALGRGRSMTGRSWTVLALVTVLVPIVGFAWQTHWFGAYTEPFQRFGWRCIALTLVMGSSLLGAVVALRRHSVATNATLQGAAAGATAGACATVVVDAWCPLANTAHVAQGHILPLVALTLVGALLGRFVLGIRARAR